jgi:tetratricopeptide (TPR) repeat protein
MYRRALVGYEEVVGLGGTRGLSTLYNLGAVLRRQGKMDEAETFFLRGLKGKKSAFGSENLSTLLTNVSQAQLYEAQGRIEEAKAMYLEAVTIRIRAYSW